MIYDYQTLKKYSVSNDSTPLSGNPKFYNDSFNC